MNKLSKIGIFSILLLSLVLVASIIPFISSFDESNDLTDYQDSYYAWNITKTGAEEEMEVEYNIINKTSTEFCIKIKDKSDYKEWAVNNNKDISKIPININSGNLSFSINSINFDGEELEIEKCFDVFYEYLDEGLSFKIGWNSINIETVITSAYRFNSLAISSDGQYRMIYSNNSAANIAYCEGEPGSWSCENIVDGSGLNIKDMSIAVDSNDVNHICYLDYNDVGGSRGAYYCNGTAGDWTCENMAPGVNVGGACSIAIDNNNKVHVSYWIRSPSLKYCSGNYGDWTCEEVIAGTSIYHGDPSSIAIDSNNEVHIAFSGHFGGDFLSYCNGTAGDWTCENITAVDSSNTHPSIAIDSNDQVHIAFYTYPSPEGILNYCNGNYGDWSCEEAEAVGFDDIGGYPQLALDSNNKAHILHYSWTDTSIRYCNNTIGWSCMEVNSDTPTLTYANRAAAIKKGRIVDSSSFDSNFSFNWISGTNLNFGQISLPSVEDTTPPTYSDNQTNGTLVSESILFSLLWDDTESLNPLGQYIFSTNNTGTWENDSAINFTTTPSWANVTKTLNDTVGISIGYRWYATDNASNLNASEIFTLTTTDTIAPVWSQNSTNSTVVGQSILHILNWVDNIGLSSYIFSFCNGTWNGAACVAIAGDAPADWSDLDYTYRECFDVTETSSGVLTDFQINYTLDTATLIGAGKMEADCHDVRVYENEASALPYWFQDNDCDTATTEIIFQTDLTSDEVQEVCIYYGYVSATDARDGEATFDFFDDFSGDLSKWYIPSAYSDVISIASGRLRQDADNSGDANQGSKINTSLYSMSDGIFEYTINLQGGAARKIGQIGWRVGDATLPNGYAFRLQNSASDGGFFEFSGGSWGSIGTSYAAISPATDYEMKLYALGSQMDMYQDGNLIKQVTDATTASGGLVSHLHGVAMIVGTDYLELDDVRTRQLIASMPTSNSGSEENQTGGSISWVNDSAVSMIGTNNWSNVSKTINSTVGIQYAWCVYTNDTSNNWNSSSCINPFVYVTTSAQIDYTRDVSELSFFIDNINRIIDATRMSELSLSLSEGITRILNLFRITLNTFSIQDSIDRLLNLFRTPSDILSIQSSVDRVLGLFRSIIETIRIFLGLNTITNLSAPTYSDNQTNSTIAGETILHSLKWEDDNGLSGYIFQFCDGNWNGSDCGNWANSSFDKCKDITITNVGSSTLIDFPVYVNLTKDTDMLSDYTDLRFYDTSCDNGGDLLNYEIENYTSTKAHIWVKTTLSTGDNVISVYYKNNTAVSSIENATGVWDDNYVMVQHLQETDIDGDAGDIKDSTSFGNDGQTSSMDTFDQVLGKIDGSFDFDGNGDYVTMGDTLEGMSDMSISLWINFDDLSLFGTDASKIQGLIVKGSRAAGGFSDISYQLYWDPRVAQNTIRFAFINSSVFGSSVFITSFNSLVSAGEWVHIVATKNDTFQAIYLNSVIKNNITSGIAIGITNNVAYPFKIGGHDDRDNAHRYFDGIIDEVRISNIVRSADWINQSYQLVQNQGTYVIAGSEENRVEWVNDTWVAFSTNPDWSNVTKTITSTIGVNVSWCVHANDTSNRWNSTSCINPFVYVTTSAQIDYTRDVLELSFFIDNINRIIDATRISSLSLSLSEGITRILNLFRIPTNIFSIQESVTRLLDLFRIPTENILILENIDKDQTLTRTISNQFSIIDSISRLLGLFRISSEDILISESIDKDQTLTRTLLNLLNIQDDADRQLGLFRITANLFSIQESIDRLLSLFRIPTENILISESIDKDQTLTRTILNQFSIQESISRLLGLFRISSEDILISESIDKDQTLTRTLQNLINIQDSISRTLGLFRIQSDIIIETDKITRTLGLFRIQTNIFSIQDSIDRLLNLFRIPTENILISESIDKDQTLTRAISNLLNIQDDADRQLDLFRIASNLINIQDSIGRTLDLFRINPFLFSIQDSVSRLLNLFRTPSDNILIIDKLIEEGDISVLISDILSILESIDKDQTLTRAISNLLNIQDSVNRVLGLFRTNQDLISILDSASKLKDIQLLISDILNIEDSVSRALSLFRIPSVIMNFILSLLGFEDTTAPVITLVSPANNTIDLDGSVSFTYNPADASNITNCSLIYNGTTIYTSTSSVTRGVNNIILVTGITEGHALYSDVLRWSINCTDSVGNVGVSEIRTLDTRRDSGTGYEGGIGSTSVIFNPKNINIFYSKEWIRGEDEIIEVESFDISGNLFEPNIIDFNHLILGIILRDQKFIINRSINIFEISKLTELGNYTIEVIVSDERIIKQNITIEIVESKITIANRIDSIIKSNRLYFWVAIGTLIFVFILCFIIAIIIDVNRKH